MQKYDVSVVIAVYNSEKYLKECIDSLVNQNYLFEKIQVLLIDDGSTDNSYQIGKEYEEKYSNIKIIKQSNKGVSAARNQGLKIAEGKYIMILDSDDFISENTIKNLVKFMDENEQIDIASYTMKNYREGKVTEHYRNSLYTLGTGIYNIEMFPHLSQATINIIFRNQFEKNELYDEKMTLAEDEKFNTQYIMKKGLIGYCKAATYFYRKHQNSVSSTSQNPYYCFDQFMEYFEYLIRTYTKEGKLSKYIQGLILQMIKWRLTADLLLPYHLEAQAYEEAINRLKKVLNHIDIDTILDKTNMEIYHKMYFLKLRGVTYDLAAGYGPNSVLLNNGKIVYAEKEMDLVFNRFKIRDGKIYMLGFIKSPICEAIKPNLYISINGEDKIELPLEESNFEYYGTNVKTNTFYKFEYELPIEGTDTFKFYIKVIDNYMPVKLVLTDWCAINTRLERTKILVDDNIIEVKKAEGLFKVEREVSKKKKKLVKKQLEKLYKKINPKINYYRALAKTKKTIWLYCDRKGVIDNAYYQFKNDIQKKDGIERYYIIDGKKEEYKGYFTGKELRKNTIQKNSYRHKIIFLRSSKIITSFTSINEYSPFKKKALSWYMDLLKYELVYLQHGVLYAKLIRMYAKEFTQIDKIVISSEFEKKNFIENYKYTENDLIESGMPRFDIENPIPDRKNKILFAPSWRAYLIGNPPINGKRTIKEKVFLDSKFYKTIDKFLQDKRLEKALKEHNITLEFKLHPIFEPYKKLFKTNIDNIKIVDGVVKNEEYNLFITDYSSFQFDFARLKTPMIYYIPDETEFRAGLHTYRELDLPLEEAFGDVVNTPEKLIDKIENYIKGDFKVEEKYQERMDNFFFKPENCREKIYQKLIK
ncbi:MAG: glycosyltransferase [Clostridia bacterium]|nr:glycosyltransferase [Clostridia bacterium]